jgi:hypothetical protein
MDRAYSTYEKRNACRILVGKPEGIRPRGRPRRWMYNIRMDVREEGRSEFDCIDVAQHRDRW